MIIIITTTEVKNNNGIKLDRISISFTSKYIKMSLSQFLQTEAFSVYTNNGVVSGM